MNRSTTARKPRRPLPPALYMLSRSTKYGPIATRHIYDRMRQLPVGAQFTLEARSAFNNVRYRDHFLRQLR
jgi:hypothetical protein